MTDAVRPSELDPRVAARLKRNPDGLMAAIAQQYDTGEVLMLGWMDDEALHRTLTTGRCTYWSRSRQEYWVKGETSGHAQRVVSAALDCDGDAVLVKVDQTGGGAGRPRVRTRSRRGGRRRPAGAAVGPPGVGTGGYRRSSPHPRQHRDG